MTNMNELIEMEIIPIWSESKSQSLTHLSSGDWIIPEDNDNFKKSIKA